MKKIFTFLLSAIISSSAIAQKITITLNGVNKNVSYQVKMDGINYFSNGSTDMENSGTTGKREVVLTNQKTGSHNLEVYRFRNIQYASYDTNTPSNAIYNKPFRLRQDYDVYITITGNGEVNFREKRRKN